MQDDIVHIILYVIVSKHLKNCFKYAIFSSPAPQYKTHWLMFLLAEQAWSHEALADEINVAIKQVPVYLNLE